MAKFCIMLVRVFGLVAIVLGILLWTGRQTLLAPHIGCGFLVSIVAFVLGLIGLIKKAVVPGILGILLALLLPMVGFMQLPILFHTLGAIQVAHIVLALVIVGVAERLYAAIRVAR